jgi:cellulose synthase (UDP-forming)
MTLTNEQDYRYNYIVKNPTKLRVVYFFTFIAWIFSLIGLIKFFDLSPWYWIFFAPFFLPQVISRTVTYLTSSFFPGFVLKDHEKLKSKYWSVNHPTVDVFLPIAGESVEMLQETWESVAKLNYDKYKVYVLEDKVDLKARKLAKELGFKYLSRPNKGEDKKAGNLRYGFQNSKGEFVLILDADFVPHPEIINESLPYFTNEQIGIVQSPQYFETNNTVHKRSSIEFGAGNVVEDFYRIIQPSRDHFGAAICVGTNSIHRRSAVKESHAHRLLENAEDVVAGLNLIKYGYELKYIPLILARGVCPDNIESYFKQHNRWATGSILMLFSAFFWRIRMTNMQRLIFASGPFYYISEAFSLLISLQLFFLLFFHSDYITLGHVLWFLPHLVMKRLVIPFSKVTKAKRGTILAALTQVYTYMFALWSVIINSSSEWVPTNIKNLTVSKNFKSIVWVNRTYLVIWSFLIGVIVYKNRNLRLNPDNAVLLLWLVYTYLMHGYFFLSSFGYIFSRNWAARKIRIAEKNKVKILAREKLRKEKLAIKKALDEARELEKIQKQEAKIAKQIERNLKKSPNSIPVFASHALALIVHKNQSAKSSGILNRSQDTSMVANLIYKISINLLIFSLVFFGSSVYLYITNTTFQDLREFTNINQLANLPKISFLD